MIKHYFKKYPYFISTLLFLITALFIVDIWTLLNSNYPYLFGITQSNFPIFETTSIYLPVLSKASIVDLFRIDYSGSDLTQSITGFPYTMLAIFHLIRWLCFENIVAAYSACHLFFILQFVMSYLLLQKIHKDDLLNAALGLSCYLINWKADKFLIVLLGSVILLLTLKKFRISRKTVLIHSGIVLFWLISLLVSLTLIRGQYISSFDLIRFISPMISNSLLTLSLYLLAETFSKLDNSNITYSRLTFYGIIIGLSFHIYYLVTLLLGIVVLVMFGLTPQIQKKQKTYYFLSILFLLAIPFFFSAFSTHSNPYLQDFIYRGYSTVTFTLFYSWGILNKFFILLVSLVLLIVAHKKSSTPSFYSKIGIGLSVGILTIALFNHVQNSLYLPQPTLVTRFIPISISINIACFIHWFINRKNINLDQSNTHTSFLNTLAASIWIAILVFILTSAIGQKNWITTTLGPANQNQAETIETLKPMLPKENTLFITNDLTMTLLSQAVTTWHTLLPNLWNSYSHYSFIYKQFIYLCRLLDINAEDSFNMIHTENIPQDKTGTYMLNPQKVYTLPFINPNQRTLLKMPTTLKKDIENGFKETSLDDALTYISNYETYILLPTKKTNLKLIKYCEKLHTIDDYTLYKLNKNKLNQPITD